MAGLAVEIRLPVAIRQVDGFDNRLELHARWHDASTRKESMARHDEDRADKRTPEQQRTEGPPPEERRKRRRDQQAETEAADEDEARGRHQRIRRKQAHSSTAPPQA